jgi:hypothetical protein
MEEKAKKRQNKKKRQPMQKTDNAKNRQCKKPTKMTKQKKERQANEKEGMRNPFCFSIQNPGTTQDVSNGFTHSP